MKDGETFVACRFCDWRGKRKGSSLSAQLKPCPRCDGLVALARERHAKRLHGCGHAVAERGHPEPKCGPCYRRERVAELGPAPRELVMVTRLEGRRLVFRIPRGLERGSGGRRRPARRLGGR